MLPRPKLEGSWHYRLLEIAQLRHGVDGVSEVGLSDRTRRRMVTNIIHPAVS